MPSNNARQDQKGKIMSIRTIQVKTAEQSLSLTVARTVRREKIRTGLIFKDTGRIIKKVSVQYGIGVHGEGKNLKDAVADFQSRWDFFCANRHDIAMGRMDLI
jgi:hypothetical protein